MRPLARGLVFACLAFVSGCIVEVTFDPVGTAASVQGSWLLGGEQASAEACASWGVSHVRVRFHDEERTFDHPDLVFECAGGAFDTRPNAVLAPGTWTVTLVAIDPEGNAISTGPEATLEARDGHAVLSVVDFEPPPVEARRVTRQRTARCAPRGR